MFGIFKMFVYAHFSFYLNYFFDHSDMENIYGSNDTKKKNSKKKCFQPKHKEYTILPSKCVSVYVFFTIDLFENVILRVKCDSIYFVGSHTRI